MQEEQERQQTQRNELSAEAATLEAEEATPEDAAPEVWYGTATELEASLSAWDQLLLQRTAQELAERHEKRLSQRMPPKPLG